MLSVHGLFGTLNVIGLIEYNGEVRLSTTGKGVYISIYMLILVQKRYSVVSFVMLSIPSLQCNIKKQCGDKQGL